MPTDTAPRYRRILSRVGLAALVLAVHGLAFVLIRVAVPAGGDGVATGERSIAWVTLPPISDTVVEAPTKPAAQMPARSGAKASAPVPPSRNSGTQTGIANAALAPAPAARHDPVLCGEPSRKGEDPCPALRPKLKNANLPLRPPTEREKQLTEKFARDLAVQNAPSKLPCVMGPAIDPICVALQALHGFSMASYVDMPNSPYARRNETKPMHWAKEPKDRWRRAPAPGVPSQEYLALAGGGKKK